MAGINSSRSEFLERRVRTTGAEVVCERLARQVGAGGVTGGVAQERDAPDVRAALAVLGDHVAEGEGRGEEDCEY